MTKTIAFALLASLMLLGLGELEPDRIVISGDDIVPILIEPHMAAIVPGTAGTVMTSSGTWIMPTTCSTATASNAGQTIILTTVGGSGGGAINQ